MSEKEWGDLDRRELTILSRWFWGVVVFAVGAFLYFAPKVVWAEDVPLHVLEKNGVEIRLMDTPCVDEISKGLVKPKYHSRLKAIQSVSPERDGSRKPYAGCWLEFTQEEYPVPAFLLVFSDGQSGVVPKEEFRKVRGQSGA